MDRPEQKKAPQCPDCGQEARYSEEYECWVCDGCDIEFYEDDEYEDWDEEGED